MFCANDAREAAHTTSVHIAQTNGEVEILMQLSVFTQVTIDKSKLANRSQILSAEILCLSHSKLQVECPT